MLHRFFMPCVLIACLLAASGIVVADDGQKTVLITGANRGIGFEFVKQYSDRGYRVIATARSPERADELNDFAEANDNVVVETLDLVDFAGIETLAAKYARQPIDLLINNAALMRGPDEGQTFGSIDYQAFDTFFSTNVKGPLKVAESFWPNVVASENGVVVSLTTSQGRQGIPVPGFAFYKSSKAAIDNLHRDIGRRGKQDGVIVLTLIPGRVATHGEEETRGMVPIEQSIGDMINVIDAATLKDNGKSFWYNGAESSGA